MLAPRIHLSVAAVKQPTSVSYLERGGFRLYDPLDGGDPTGQRPGAPVRRAVAK
jgi:hypothetical protein